MRRGATALGPVLSWPCSSSGSSALSVRLRVVHVLLGLEGGLQVDVPILRMKADVDVPKFDCCVAPVEGVRPVPESVRVCCTIRTAVSRSTSQILVETEHRTARGCFTPS
jgi:hypothetical protein